MSSHLEGGHLVAGTQVPNPRRVVMTTSGQLSSIWAEGDTGDTLGVALIDGMGR